MSLLGRPAAMRSSVCVRHAFGSTSFRRATRGCGERMRLSQRYHRPPHNRDHSAGFLTFEAEVRYPFHPLVGPVVGGKVHD